MVVVEDRYNTTLRVVVNQLNKVISHNEKLTAENNALAAALDFYANPESYHGIAFMGDPPCGEFGNDFSADHGHSYYDREMPGHKARTVLRVYGWYASSDESGPDPDLPAASGSEDNASDEPDTSSG